jgi:Transcriptional regulator
MEINQLRFFQKVATLEHMTRAANELRVAQPALSKTIRQLETELGYLLFDRVGKNIHLNANGRILLKHATAILNELDDLRLEIQETNKHRENEVVLSMQAASQLLPAIISGFRKAHPQIKISITQENPLQGDRWDVGIQASRLSIQTNNSRTVLKENILLALPSEHRLAGKEVVKLSELAGESFIGLQKGKPLREISDEYCIMAGFTPTVVLESDNPATIRDLLELGLGVCLIPEITWKVKSSERMRLVKVVSPVCRRYLNIVTQNRSYTPDAVEHFKEYLVDFFGKLQSSHDAG